MDRQQIRNGVGVLLVASVALANPACSGAVALLVESVFVLAQLLSILGVVVTTYLAFGRRGMTDETSGRRTSIGRVGLAAILGAVVLFVLVVLLQGPVVSPECVRGLGAHA